MTQWTLADRADLFAWGSSQEAGRRFRLLALLQAGSGIVLGVVLGLISESVLIGAAFAVFTFGAAALMWWLAGKQQGWRLRDGRELRSRTLLLRDDPDESWQRLATGDPAVYTPMRAEVSRHVLGASVHALWPLDERVTWVVIVRGDGGGASTLIELRDAQHDAMQAALARGLHRAAA